MKIAAFILAYLTLGWFTLILDSVLSKTKAMRPFVFFLWPIQVVGFVLVLFISSAWAAIDWSSRRIGEDIKSCFQPKTK